MIELFEGAFNWLLSRNPAYTLAGGVVIPFLVWAGKIGWTKTREKLGAIRRGDRLAITARTTNLVQRLNAPAGWILFEDELMHPTDLVVQAPVRGKSLNVKILRCDVTRELNRRERKLIAEAVANLRATLLLNQTTAQTPPPNIHPLGTVDPRMLPPGMVCSGMIGTGETDPAGRNTRRGGVHSAG